VQSTSRASEPAINLLKVPLLGTLLRSPRLAFQLPLLLLALAMMAHGFVGPKLSPKNLATTLSWVHYRGALVLVLLGAGNLFCFACPFVLVRDLARRLHTPTRNWPHALRGKWLSLALFVLVLFAYELFDLWASPLLTAALILGYFAACLLVDLTFKHGSFCKFVCPIGQFSFVTSTLSPLEVRVSNLDVCATCTTHDCIRGQRDAHAPQRIVKRGCELALYQPRKVGNLDCTFCMDCVVACPHDNVGVFTRLPGAELWATGPRAGLGQPEKRADLSVFAILFTFAALLNALAMVSPVYALEAWLAEQLHTTHEAPVLALLFAFALVVEPVLLLGVCASAIRLLSGTRDSLLTIVTRFSYALVPVGVAVWLAHYGFHFFTGLFTLVPVLLGALRDLGLSVEVRYGTPGLAPGLLWPLELGFLGLGVVGSAVTSYRIAERWYGHRARRACLPFALLSLLLAVSAAWLLAQPMEMRGTFLGG
jgi:ferredoxin